MKNKDFRVLITGSSGFTGRYLRDELENIGYEVYGLSVQSPEFSESADLRCDLLNAGQVASLIKEIDPHYVVHLAAISYVAHNSAKQLYDVNIMGTRNLLEAIQNHGNSLQKVVIASSANVYGNNGTYPLTENFELKPSNDYAISKVAVEHLANLYSELIPIVVTRPFNYTGAGQSRQFLIPKLVQLFASRAESIELGNLQVSRDFSDVRTVVWAYSRLLEKGLPGDTYNIASGHARSISSVILDLQEITGHYPQIEQTPNLLRKGEVVSLRGDASKLWNLIGKPPEVSFTETLQWMLSVEE